MKRIVSLLSNILRQRDKTDVKNNLTNPKMGGLVYRIKLKKEVWEGIKKTKCWKERGAISRFAEYLGVSRQYAQMVISNGVGLSAVLMLKIIDLTGNISNHRWSELFEIVRHGDFDENHPAFNIDKYLGEKPYSRYSASTEERSKDYPVEKKS